MSSTRRTSRIAEAIKKELDVLLRQHVELDSMIITVTGVDPAPDLKHAIVYIRTIGTAMTDEKVITLLIKKKVHIQRALARRLPIKFVPRLVFRTDTFQEHGDRIFEVLQEIETDETPTSSTDQ
jgi:ribosome-binding factor A